ncbi:sulfite exporter TauE/SafE family protein [Futiania mangrovi]|uniref:Probable membrane transporter protein n=1 Tax=Futiania mangrovi TaxID=2959716 RepID=A0A9J6PDQ8_9PROT|nr:sulfite exporter TauE/SafE family protein [Futiania mangrovii]MCP1335859.1 sulfite exporter TauE/SafE family protein [Futiania mangrovii]
MIDIGGLTGPEIALAVAAIGVTAAFVGFMAGLLGIGGGMILVPILDKIFTSIGVPDETAIRLSVGTSLATVVVTAIRSARSHYKRGSFDPEVAKAWAPWIVIGASAGAVIASVIAGASLRGVFGVVAIVLALNMAFGKEEWRISTRLPEFLRWAIGTLVGGVAVMMGLGVGGLGVPAMTLYGIDIRRAVGTAAGLGLATSIPGALVLMYQGLDAPGLPPFSLGYVNFVAFALIVPITILTAPLGVAANHKISMKALRRAFAVFLALMAFRMLSGIW